MKCPIDGSILQLTDRQGVEIDYCPQCRGIWLDRGELDKLIEKSEARDTARPQRREEEDDDRGHKDDKYRRDDRREFEGKKKRRGSFLGDLLDF